MENFKDKLQGSTALLFSFRHLSAYQLLMRLCCRIKLLSQPEGILQEQKAADLKGRSKEYTTQKPKGKEAAKKCREANWNIKQPTLVTGDISSNPGIMQAEPGPKYPRDLVLAGPQCCGRRDPGYINTKEHLYNCCMAQAHSHRHPIATGVWQVPVLAPSPSRTPAHSCTSPECSPGEEPIRLSSLSQAPQAHGSSGALGNSICICSSKESCEISNQTFS